MGLGRKPSVGKTDLQSFAGWWVEVAAAHWSLARCGTNALLSTVPPNSFQSAGPPDRELLGALMVGVNNSLGLLATWGQLCLGGGSSGGGPHLLETPAWLGSCPQ